MSRLGKKRPYADPSWCRSGGCLLVQSLDAGSTSTQALTPNHTEIQQIKCCKVIILDELILVSSPGPGKRSSSAYAPLAKVNQLSYHYCLVVANRQWSGACGPDPWSIVPRNVIPQSRWLQFLGDGCKKTSPKLSEARIPTVAQ